MNSPECQKGNFHDLMVNVLPEGHLTAAESVSLKKSGFFQQNAAPRAERVPKADGRRIRVCPERVVAMDARPERSAALQDLAPGAGAGGSRRRGRRPVSELISPSKAG